MKLLIYRLDISGHVLHQCVSWTGQCPEALLRTIMEWSRNGYFCRVVVLP